MLVKDKFDLEWFKRNRRTADKIMNFHQELFWIKSNVRLKIKKDVAEFTLIQGKELIPFGQLKIEGNRFIDIDPRKAIYDPHIYMIAERLKYLTFPKSWKAISKYFKDSYVSWVWKKNVKTGSVIVYLRDKYGNRFYLPISTFNSIKNTEGMKKNNYQTKYPYC